LGQAGVPVSPQVLPIPVQVLSAPTILASTNGEFIVEPQPANVPVANLPGSPRPEMAFSGALLPATTAPLSGPMPGGAGDEELWEQLSVLPRPAEDQDDAQPGAPVGKQPAVLDGQGAEMVTSFQPERAAPLASGTQVLFELLDPLEDMLGDWLISTRLAPWLIGLMLTGGAAEMLRRRSEADDRAHAETLALSDLA